MALSRQSPEHKSINLYASGPPLLQPLKLMKSPLVLPKPREGPSNCEAQAGLQPTMASRRSENCPVEVWTSQARLDSLLAPDRCHCPCFVRRQEGRRNINMCCKQHILL